MLSSPFSPWRSVLTPQAALDLANVHLENARKAKNTEMVLNFCDDAEAALARIRTSVRKTSVSSSRDEDRVLCNEIATTYSELGKLFDSLGRRSKAQASYKNEEKWGGRVALPAKLSSHPNNVASSPASSSPADLTANLAANPSIAHKVSPLPPPPSQPLIQGNSIRDIAKIPQHIFAKDMYQSPDINKLPTVGGRFESISQLVHCLALLQREQFDEDLDQSERDWLKAAEHDTEEHEGLRRLAINMLKEFTHDELKNADVVAEVVCLVPVLEKSELQKLLRQLFHGIEQSEMLDFDLVEGLAQLVQRARPDHLDADNLVKTLELISKRLRGTHGQSPDYINQLTLTVSRVLDAMADTNIKGLDRENLHAPLAAYLQGLKGNTDPHLVYQAAYASQALLYVPDNETPWQATQRRTGKVVKGVAGLVSAVKGLDLNQFVDSLSHIQEGLAGAVEVFEVAKSAYEEVSALAESGEQFLESLKEGLSFSRKRAWYPALRGADVLLRNGQLVEFKRLICEAPCRRDPVFQWGVCQRLGEIAANPQCDDDSRTSAVAFLGEIYQSDTVWGHHVKIKQLILDILMQLTAPKAPSGIEIQAAETLLWKLETDGDAKKQALYKACRREGPGPHPPQPAVHPPLSPSLLDRVQNTVDVETSLRKLKKRRLEGKSNDVCISPLAKAGLKARDDALFSLMDKLKEFLGGEQKVFLLLGDSGAGKSTFNQELECDLWNNYKKHDGHIPLFITLAAIQDPEHDMIAKQLRIEGFTEPQIQELKDHREFILICDGYDECRQMQNFYMSNRLNQAGGWGARMVISCRSDYLGADYQDMFQPLDRNRRVKSPLFQEAVVAPFSKNQIQEYIQQYVAKNSRKWSATDYMQALDRIHGLKDMVTNPFLLSLSLEVLPRMVHPGQAVSTTRITRVALYDQFVEQWLERGKIRLFENVSLLDSRDKEAFQNLSNEGFMQQGITLLKDLAVAIYERQAGNPVVAYSSVQDKGTWKEEFFGQGHEKKLLRESCPLKRNGNQHRFLHKSLLEYTLARAIFEPQDEGNDEEEYETSTTAEFSQRSDSSSYISEDEEDEEDLDETIAVVAQPVIDSPLGRKSYVGEPSILQFLVERVHQEPLFKKQLLSVIERSKTHATEVQTVLAAANAITILVRAGVQFNGADLQGIQIPGADLSHGAFESTNFQGANLSNAILLNISLYGANLNTAQMSGVQFGELPFLQEESNVTSCVYSLDGKTFAIGLGNGDISIYTTLDFNKIRTMSGHFESISGVAYSPKGDQLVSGSEDMTVRLWDVETGDCRHTLSGHSLYISSVAYSPKGDQVASGSRDETVRLWDVETGDCRHTLIGHSAGVTSVVYSPKGDQIASCSPDKTVWLWDSETGDCRHTLIGHSESVSSIVYSPKGDQIASGSDDRTVRLWDVETGDCHQTLSGHLSFVSCIAYSPKGDRIASGSWDSTVRLWDVETGDCHHTLSGHINSVSRVVYSPKGDQIASSSWDNTVRLWDVETGDCRHTLSGHSGTVESVVYSPKGDQIASGSYDSTVRLWNVRTRAHHHSVGDHSGSVSSVAYSPKGDQIASGSSDRTVRLWDFETGDCRHTLRAHSDNVTSVVYSPKGDQIASSSRDMTVQLWDVETGDCLQTLSGPVGWVGSVAYSPKGDQIASGSYDSTVRLWNVGTGDVRHTLSGHSDWVTSVVYSPKGDQIASGSSDKTVRLWDVETGDCRHTLSGHSDGVTSVVYSPKGDQLASGSEDMTVRIWDVGTGDCHHTLSGHTGIVSGVVYSPRGDQIASGSHDKTVRLWDTGSGECRVLIENNTEACSISWRATFDNSYVVAGFMDGVVRLWQVIEDGGECSVRLHWRSPSEKLILLNSSMQDTAGISAQNQQLLLQRGAVGEPAVL